MKICYRKWQIDDAESLCLIINDQAILNNLTDRIPYPYTIKDGKEYITSVMNSNIYAYAIEVDGSLVGSISVIPQNDIYRYSGEIGYFLAKEYWSKGIMSDVVQKVCYDILKNTDIERIYAAPFVHNRASCRVLEKSKFVYEGILRHQGYKNGQFYDMKMYSLLKKDIMNL